jgi:hypothetical protein
VFKQLVKECFNKATPDIMGSFGVVYSFLSTYAPVLLESPQASEVWRRGRNV